MSKQFANPRLVDVLGLGLTQDDAPFAIPHLHGDIPLYVDPFLLWVSEDPQYRALHEQLISFFRLLCEFVRAGKIDAASRLLAECEEPRAMGLGYASGSRRGSNIGPGLISSILATIDAVPQLRAAQIRHMEELQLVVPGFAEDRTSDTASSILKPFFLQYTAEQAAAFKIPTRTSRLGNIYDPSSRLWIPAPELALPYNPVDNTAIILVPLNLLRRLPWINYDDYYRSSFARRVLDPNTRSRRVAKEAVLQFNARNYVQVERYVGDRERLGAKCHPDPLFVPLTTATLRARFAKLRSLPTGSGAGVDRQYEDLVIELLSSLFYPTLEFAEQRVRTASGAHIRDLIFYNDGKSDCFRDLRERYDARQPVFEIKNVRALEPEHVNQLYRYLDEEFGRFGVLVTRNPLPSNVARNIVDLHSSKRVVILTLDDRDFEEMLALSDCGRDPAEIVKKKFLEFTRRLPK